MKFNLENIITVLALIISEAWFLHGYFADKPDFEPALAVLLAVGAIFAKETIKEKLHIGLDKKKHDQLLFQNFLKELPTEPTLRFLREHDFGNSFREEYIRPLYYFVASWDSVEKEFLDKKYEQKKKTLYSSAQKLSSEISARTVPVKTDGYVSVFSDSMRASGQPRPASVIEDARVLNDLSTKFVPIYEDFVRTCRSKLAD